MIAGARALQSKLSLFTELGASDLETLEELVSGPPQELRRGVDIVSQGEQWSQGLIVLDGWATRYKTLSDGRRQILAFLAPGDLVGSFAPVCRVATFSVGTLTRASVATYDTTAAMQVMATAPRLGAALAWAAAREHEIMAEHLVSVGRRSAQERVAHLFLELWARLRVRGMADGKHLSVPLTQATIADSLGLSVVHVNRTLKQLARDGLLEVQRERVSILDLARLQELAGFDEAYLLHHGMPPELQAALDAGEDRPRVREVAMGDARSA